MKRDNEEMKLWLFDLAHGNLNDKDVISGFIKHYVLYDLSLWDVKRDIIYHTTYGNDGVITAIETLNRSLRKLI